VYTACKNKSCKGPAIGQREDRRHVTCVEERPGLNPGPWILGGELTDCVSLPVPNCLVNYYCNPIPRLSGDKSSEIFFFYIAFWMLFFSVVNLCTIMDLSSYVIFLIKS
jgi:hypothetical protein